MFRTDKHHGSSFSAPLLIAKAAIFTVIASSARVCSADVYKTKDDSVTFSYPQSWQVSEANGAVNITASDGSLFNLKFDVPINLPAGAPVNDVGLKQSAIKIAAPVSKTMTFSRASSISMDHGQGASFRFKSTAGDVIDVWIGFIGKHNAVLTPAKTGMPANTLGLTVIYQSMAFTDSLPKAPPVRPGRPGNDATPNSPGTTMENGQRTVRFSTQIAPILSDRCVSCHSHDSAAGGFDVSSYNTVLAGGRKANEIKPGNIAKSTLIDYLTGVRDRMPKGSNPLSPAEINLFRTWIQEGATNDLDPNSKMANTTTDPATPPAAGKGKKKFGAAAASSNNRRMVVPGAVKETVAYTGHLATNDIAFVLRKYTNNTVKAVWTFDNASATLEGTFTSVSGIDDIKLNVIAGAIPGGTKSIRIMMSESGTDVIGKFSLDETTPRFKITGLQLSEIDNATKNPNVGKGTAAKRKK